MTDDFLVFGRPRFEQAEIDEVVDCLRKGWVGTGPKVARFEEEFAAYKGVPFAAALNSCTAGLHLSLLCLDLEPDAEVITTPLTFCATVNAIIHAGATPVLADVDPDTGNIDPAAIERAITLKTRAILLVHLNGRACDMGALMAIADKHGLRVVEDCAHAVETEYRGAKAGTFGDLGVFSFYATKNLATGEGGMVVSENADLIERIKTLGLHGLSADAWTRFSDDGYKHFFVSQAGFKYNMMDMQAAIGIHQLARIEKNWRRRQEIWKKYMQAFNELPVTLPARPEANSRHAYHLFTLLIGEDAPVDRDHFLERMTAENIGVGVHYLSIPEHPFYRETLGWRPKDWPNAMKIGRQTVSLPITMTMDDRDVDRVINTTREILEPS